MDIQRIQELLEKTKASFDNYKSNGVEASRIEAQEQAFRLARALERPRDAILKLAYSPAIVMAMKVALDLNVFPVLAQATSPVPLAELAAAKPADPILVERILRVLVANAVVEEPAPSEYLPTALSKELTKRPSIGVLESLFCEFLPSFQKTPEFLKSTNYRNPDDPLDAPLQYTHDLGRLNGFTWLCQNPDALSRFNSFMEGQRADRLHWGDWFPVRERVLDHPELTAETPLIVDIGAGRGHDLIGFRQRFPDALGKLVLEDLSTVIEEVRGAQDLEAAKVDTQVFDFFNEVQPVQGARVYYFKNVMHDWSDEKAAIIFNNLKPAMKRGFSKIIMEEYILPDQNASSLPCTTDMAVMIFCSGLERSRQRWDNLLSANGLRALKYWAREGDGLGIVEAELA
ncbi:Plant methyltransferase dimerization [Penicillium macrosclerotiorum]|uniref:Plant methyltransferase dimerization n=1 Tax=Penicillium macrosclerotiorum TaxID=303699 RepID=UPI002546DE94|nr:Plant methyltransferase dimerization [Penicillium macrosclerotiorum]KAJ5689626.1 Plant methyltransferase dimerization [Penicillium macrosclerotiorum]